MFYDKDPNGKTWYVQFYYKDYAGNRKRKRKTGFATKREAEQWAINFIRKEQSDMDMLFEDFVESYWEDIQADLKESTVDTKKHIIDLHVTPFFRGRKVRDITGQDIIKWQAELKKKGYSETYLRSIDAQIRAIFNHATKVYYLSVNPCDGVKTMGKHKSGNMGIWSDEDFKAFISTVNSDTSYYYAYKLMYWTGMRLGEMLALTLGDLDLDDKSVMITKTYRRKKGKDIITLPKTEESVRKIYLPTFLVDELKNYTSRLYGIMKEDRLFAVSKGGIEKDFKNAIQNANKTVYIKDIRLHDLRHSHASLLISKGIDVAAISKRLGHRSIRVTLETYCHLFDGMAKGVADDLDKMFGATNCVDDDFEDDEEE